LNRIVPYYYYRYTSTGVNSSASGCGNDTASERYMFGKYMVDSTSYWIEEYNLDGLRFDLMGLHDLETMKNVEKNR
jgi:pullulanase